MKRIFACLLLIATLVSCKKEVMELPPATQTGANTFGAKVNGSLWVPQGFGSLPANDILEARMGGNDLIINAQNFSSSPNETEFVIVVLGITGPGTYELNTTVTHPTTDHSYAYYVKRTLTPTSEWITSSSSKGTVTITHFDQAKRIISGTFQFTMAGIFNAPEPLSVTEGRFDVKLQ